MIICKKCGNRNEDRDQFCTSCGSFLEWSGERVVEKEPEPAPQPVAPPPPPPPPPMGFVDQLKERVGMESGQAPPPPVTGGWVPPASVAAQTTVPVPSSPSARRPDAPPPDPEAPQARQPEEAPPPPPRSPRIMPAIVPEVNEVGTFCSNCGAGNDVRRHFCRRCGAPLMRAAVNRLPWWQRLFPRRDLSAGDRPFRESSTTFGSVLRTFLVTMLLVVLLGSIFAYLAVPAFRQAVNREVDIGVTDLRRLINPSYVQVHPVTTSATSEISGHPASYLTDLISNDYWAADLNRDSQPTWTFTFDGPTDLDALVVTNGAAGSYAQLARPRTLQISYSDGTGEQVTLNDVGQPTAYDIHARGVTSMTVRVVNTYPASNGSTQVGLAEIEFRKLA